MADVEELNEWGAYRMDGLVISCGEPRSMFREWGTMEKLAGGVIIFCVLAAIVLFAMS
jgi:hypothetical protein